MADTSASATTLARQHRALLALLALVTVACWAVVLRASVAAGMGSSMGAGMTGLTMGLDWLAFLAVWIAMMAAMMFPAAAPMILMFASIAARKRERAQTFAPAWIFVAGYLLVWTAFGALAYALALAADAVGMRSPWLAQNGGRIAGLLLMLAGLYQLSPLKRACLSRCRTPLQFILTSWRDGYRGALTMGIHHGAYCLGCCWLLFVILFPLGVMNLAIMALLTLVIFAEKALPAAEWTRRLVAAALLAYGAAVLFMPSLLPGAAM